MRRIRLFSGKTGLWIFSVFVLFVGISCLTIPLYSQAIIIDHNCTGISLIPGSWINTAKSILRCSYGHTSHGSQLISGMTALMKDAASGDLYDFNTNGAISIGVLSIADYTPDGDLGNPDLVEWEARTRDYLDGSGSNRNVVMWSWCGQVSSASETAINTYLTLMDGLEQDYPNVTFVYMTGHLDGTGESGNLHKRNNQIRNWCLANSKVLFDFADIESYDPDGNYFLDRGANDACDYSGGNWADEWIAANLDSQLTILATACGSCAHSRALNCILKGRATWWLMARIAGWDGNTSAQPSITVKTPKGGENWTVDSSQTITWTTTGTVGNVMIEYSSNNGSSWSTITASTANDGAYTWNIPDSPSVQCLVRISETDGSPSDTSNAVFTISEPGQMPTLTLTSPNGGEEWMVGSLHTITWTTTGTVGDVMIKYSPDNGGSWTKITASTANDGSYDWSIPNKPSVKCLVQVRESDGGPSDTSDKVFTISGGKQTAIITITSPNGGEEWMVGSMHAITWTTTGSVGDVMIKYSVDNGGSWTKITASTANDGTYKWTVPNRPSTKCLVKINDIDGSPSDISDNSFSLILLSEKPKICLNRDKFNFGCIIGGKTPKSQPLHISNCGGGILEWTSSTDAGWLTLEPGAGTGPGKLAVNVDPTDLGAGYYTGTIRIADPNAVNSPVTVTVTFKVKEASEGKHPFGSFDTPLDQVKVRSSIPVTGWALDDVEIDNVKIYREKNNELKYIGDAVFVEGARPDVENSYPDYPCNYKAGWGYMLLTNCLPNQGNGKLVLHSIAADSSGNSTTLGIKTITVDNTNAVEPFGALDSPNQGGSASGSSFINWGWVLTPPPNHIPTVGTTIKVYVDGVYIGHPHFNIYRSDIADLFPNYANSNGAAGYFPLDTTSFENGVHTIQWTATDNVGNTDGIGSRYFSIENSFPGAQSTVQETQLSQTQSDIPGFLSDLANRAVDYWEPVRVKKGVYESIEPHMIYPDNNGIITIEIKELELLELHLSEIFFEQESERNYYCYLAVGKHYRPLPLGSTFDIEKGIFYWLPGPGFLGRFRLVFLVENQNLEVLKKELLIIINPR